MKFLLDTHVFLWWLEDPERLKTKMKKLIENPENKVCLSAASALEISIKYSLKKLKLPEPPDRYVTTRLAQNRFRTIEIHTIHALELHRLPNVHKDPFDRILCAQSKIEKIPIMTLDPIFKKYPVELVAS